MLLLDTFWLEMESVHKIHTDESQVERLISILNMAGARSVLGMAEQNRECK